MNNVEVVKTADEYVVRVWVNGKREPNADYFAGSLTPEAKADAYRTAASMLLSWAQN